MQHSDSMKQKELNIIGVAGGGQLAQMMLEPAKKLGKTVYILDPDKNCSASSCCDKLINGDFNNSQDLMDFSNIVDVLTFDIEKVDHECLQTLEEKSHIIRPQASIMGMIQDKLLQKRTLFELGFPVGFFSEINDSNDDKHIFPLIWKARLGGYDGRGVIKIFNEEQLRAITTPGYIEETVKIEKELAIMVARDVFGRVEFLPIVEIEMDGETNVLKLCKAPADITIENKNRIQSLAKSIVEKLDYVGILGIEFFQSKEGKILINELSPRPHNSGHFSIEACSVSQFEQHIRAVSGLSVLPSKLIFSSVSFNVFASDSETRTEKIIEMLNQKNDRQIFRHDYLKRANRPGRKIGHVTVLDETVGAAEAIANQLLEQFI